MFIQKPCAICHHRSLSFHSHLIFSYFHELNSWTSQTLICICTLHWSAVGCLLTTRAGVRYQQDNSHCTVCIINMIKHDKYQISKFINQDKMSQCFIYLPMNISAMSSSSSQSWGRATYRAGFVVSLIVKRTHLLVLIFYRDGWAMTFIRPLLLNSVILHYTAILKKETDRRLHKPKGGSIWQTQANHRLYYFDLEDPSINIRHVTSCPAPGCQVSPVSRLLSIIRIWNFTSTSLLSLSSEYKSRNRIYGTTFYTFSTIYIYLCDKRIFIFFYF